MEHRPRFCRALSLLAGAPTILSAWVHPGEAASGPEHLKHKKLRPGIAMIVGSWLSIYFKTNILSRDGKSFIVVCCFFHHFYIGNAGGGRSLSAPVCQRIQLLLAARCYQHHAAV